MDWSKKLPKLYLNEVFLDEVNNVISKYINI